MTCKSARALASILLIACAHDGFCASEDESPSPATVSITVAEDTTRIIAPLNRDGTVNYVAHLNRRFSKGITHENNAAVTLMPLYRPNRQEEMQQIAKALGLDPERSRLVRFVPLDEYAKANASEEMLATVKIPPYPWEVEMLEKGNLSPEVREEMRKNLWIVTTKVEQQVSQDARTAEQRPWSTDEFPMIAGWLKANRETLDLLRKASRQARYHIPWVSRESPPTIVSCHIPSYSISWGRSLLLEALRKAGSDDLEGAFEDIAVLHRLARLWGQDPRIMSLLRSLDLAKQAHCGEIAIAASGKLSADQAKLRLKWVRGLKELPDPTEVIDTERYMALDSAAITARASRESFEKQLVAAFPQDRITSDQLKRIDLDWDLILRNLNALYDRGILASRRPGFEEQQKAAQLIEDQLEALRRQRRKWTREGGAAGYLRRVSQRKNIGLSEIRTMVTEAVERELTFIMWLDLKGVLTRKTECKARQTLMRVALALAAYRAETGVYPSSLGKLIPTYFSKLPTDPFTGKALLYRLKNGDYVLSSVGPNMKSDAGTPDKESDDIVVD